MEKLLLFFIVQFLFIWGLLYANKKCWNSKLKNYQVALIAALLFYISIVLIAIFLNYIYQSELDAFDLNKDGSFSQTEQTPDQQQAMRNKIADTGRNMAPIVGLLYALVYLCIIILPLKIFNRRKAVLNQ